MAVNKTSDIKALDEEVMAHYGWYKSDRAKMVTKYLESRIVEERAREEGSLEAIYNGVYFVLTGRYYE